MAVRTKNVPNERLTTKTQRKAAWLDVAKRIKHRYKVSAKDANIIATVAVDWLRDQAVRA